MSHSLATNETNVEEHRGSSAPEHRCSFFFLHFPFAFIILTTGVIAHLFAMDEDIFRLPVDETLTVKTAYTRGYEWAIDIGPATPRELLPDLYDLIQKKGYKLGKASMLWFSREEQDRGVYKPLHPSSTDIYMKK